MNKLELKVMLEAIDKATAPLKQVAESGKRAADALNTARQSLAGLEKQQKELNGWSQATTRLDELAPKLKEAQQRHEHLKASIQSESESQRQLAARRRAVLRELERHTQALHGKQRISAREVAQNQRLRQTLAGLEQKHQSGAEKLKQYREQARQAAQEIKRHGIETEKLKDRQARYAKTLNKAGIATEKFADHQKQLRLDIDRARQSIDKQEASLERLQNAKAWGSKMHRGGMVTMGHGVGLMYGAQRATMATLAPAREAIGFESAMADVRKVVDFDTPEQFRQIERDIRALSMELPMAASEIAQIIAAAGQAGIARDELRQFARDAVQMGVAFDTTAEASGQTMATWRTAFRMNQAQVVELSDRINYLGNTGPASVQKISEVVNRIGALGEVAGLQSGPLAALGATVAGMGIESEVSATGIKNLLLTLSAGEAATKKQKNALAALGLEASAMAQAMQKDAPAAILSVLEAVQKLPQAAQAATLTQLFGRESIGAIAPLLTNLTLLRENLAKVGDASQYAGSMGKEYQSRAATTANALQLLKNKGAALAITIGSVLLPQIVAISEKVGGWLEKAVAWAEANPKIAGGLAKLAVAGGAVTAVIGGLLTVGGFAAMMIGQLVKGFALLSGGNGLAGLGATAARFFAPLLGGLKAIGAAVAALAGSIGAPVIAVVAGIAAVALLIWKYWQPIKAFLGGVWDGLLEGLAPVKDAVMFALEPLMPLFDWIGEAIGSVIGWLKEFLTPLDASAETLTTASNAGKALGYAIGTVLGGSIRLLSPLLHGLFTALKTLSEWSPMGIIIRHWTPITGFFSGLFDNIKLYLTSAWNYVTGIFSGDREKVMAGLQGMWQAINSILAGWPAKMQQIGLDMMQGIVNGLLQRLPLVGQTLANIGNNAIGGLKAILGIRSPSRVFAAIGDDTMAGLDMGLGRSADGPVQRIRQLGQQLGKAGAGLALGGTLALPAAALDARAPLAPAGQGGVAQHHSYQIHITVQGNGHAPDIAAAVRQEIERIERERRVHQRIARLGDYD